MPHSPIDLTRIDEIIQTHLNYLHKTKNDDGGWGSEEGFASSPHNTAEVATALLKVDDDDVDSAIQFLLKTQNEDGGWPKASMLRGDSHSPKSGHTIATSWAVRALTGYLESLERRKFGDNRVKQNVKNSVDRALKFLLDLGKNRKGKGSWKEYLRGRSSVTATCNSVWTLLTSKSSNPNFDAEINIDDAVVNALSWLAEQQNTDGGIGFIERDKTRASATTLLAITVTYARQQSVPRIPNKLRRSIQWTISRLENEPENLLRPEVEYPSSFETVLTQYEHFIIPRVIQLIFSNDVKISNEVRQNCLNCLLELQVDRGGFFLVPQGRVHIWSTAQAILALNTIRNWGRDAVESNLQQRIPIEVISSQEGGEFHGEILSRILHLSDLHFSSEQNANLRFSQLKKDLKDEINCHELDVLIISGDVANKSTPEEYLAAKQFLENLSREFNLKEKQLVIVPGNHDLNFGISKKAYELLRKEDYSGELEEGLYIDHGDIIEVRNEHIYKQRFEHFRRFYEGVTSKPYPEEYEQQGIIHYFRQQKLVVLGLNSAWNLDHYYTDRASIHQQALSRALDHIRQNSEYRDCFKIAVWHHPVNSPFVDRIIEQEFIDNLMEVDFQIILHGQLRQDENSLHRYVLERNERKVDVIAAGTFGASTQETQAPWQYNFLKIEGHKPTVLARRCGANKGWQAEPPLTRSLAEPLPHSGVRNKVFISYSHADANLGIDRNKGIVLSYFDRLRTHLKSLERKGIIDLWDDTRIRSGSKWKEEIRTTLSSAKIALLLISGNFTASDFINENELPPLLAAAEKEGTIIIPIILSPCSLPNQIVEFQSVNPPSKTLTSMDYNEQEELFVKLAKTITETLGF